MQDIVRTKLTELVGRFGLDLSNDARRCEALLRDVCGEHKREINALVSAIRDGAGTELRQSSAGVPKELIIARLTKRLHENFGLVEDLARWAVESWVVAIGVAGADEFRSFTPDVRPNSFIQPEPYVQKEIAVDLGNGIKLEMVLIPAGEFMMGNDIEKPVHKVTITKPFYLGKYQVTQEQWQAPMGGNPSDYKGPRNPVENVSWDDCQQFFGNLNVIAGRQGGEFVLPTEAQWEYACRAGSTDKFCFGDYENQLGEYAWYTTNSGSKTHPVGVKKPNAWGLYDMHGNVWEWCQDWYGAYRAEAVDDPSGPAKGSNRVFRGGGWDDFAWICRSAYRNRITPEYRFNPLGFRVAQVPAD